MARRQDSKIHRLEDTMPQSAASNLRAVIRPIILPLFAVLFVAACGVQPVSPRVREEPQPPSAASAILSAPEAAATVVVTTAAELEAALVPANAGAQILVAEGEYEVSHPLTVPDDAILAGEGVMSFDGSGLPNGIAPSGRTVLRASATLAGDILTLGNGSTIRNLVI